MHKNTIARANNLFLGSVSIISHLARFVNREIVNKLLTKKRGLRLFLVQADEEVACCPSAEVIHGFEVGVGSFAEVTDFKKSGECGNLFAMAVKEVDADRSGILDGGGDVGVFHCFDFLSFFLT